MTSSASPVYTEWREELFTLGFDQLRETGTAAAASSPLSPAVCLLSHFAIRLIHETNYSTSHVISLAQHAPGVFSSHQTHYLVASITRPSAGVISTSCTHFDQSATAVLRQTICYPAN